MADLPIFFVFPCFGVGVISKVVNKATFDVSLRHDMFKWINVVWLSMHMFSFVTVNAYVQLCLLIVKCLIDYTYLSRQTNRPIASAFKTVVIVILLIFVCLLRKKLWARVLIVSVMDRLDLDGIIMVIAPLAATLVWVIYIYISM